jgi:hypothetical protein
VFHGAGEPVLLTNSVHLLREYALEHAASSACRRWWLRPVCCRVSERVIE